MNVSPTTEPWYVYRHFKADSLACFYVGIGKDKNRYISKANRNKFWHHVVNKHGFFSEVLTTGLSLDSACELEKFLISEYGTVIKKTGTLVNLTDGGEGTHGTIASPESRMKMSIARTGEKNHFYGKHHSEETIKKISGRIRTEDHKRKISLGKTGKPSPHKGREFPSLHGDKSHLAKLKPDDIPIIRNLLKTKMSISAIARQFSISRNSIYLIKKGLSWRNVE